MKPREGQVSLKRLLDTQLCSIAPGAACSKCRWAVLRLEKFKWDYEQLKEKLSSQLCLNRASESKSQSSMLSQNAVVRFRSPSAQKKTGNLLALKIAVVSRPSTSLRARKEFFSSWYTINQ